MRRVIWGWFAASAVVLAATAVQAQTLVADEIRTPYSSQDEVVVGRGPYAALPAPGGYGAYEEVIPPFEAVRILRATGYEPVGVPVRRRWVYMVPVINAEGFDGRVVLDAHSGRVVRFIPATFGGEDAVEAYGPPGPPPQTPTLQRMNARTSLRPPASVPHVAIRTTPKSDARLPAAAAQPVPAAPGQQLAAAPPKSTSDATAAKPADARPPAPKPAVELQPTQPMPPVQGLE
jgi:hypothetical protein